MVHCKVISLLSRKRYKKIDEVKMVPHDSKWIVSYEEERARIERVLRDQILEIHHVGSTAIPFIKAKPVIDILVVVNNINAINAYNFPMIRSGYEPRGEYGVSGRRYFTKTVGNTRTHNIHVFQFDHNFPPK